MFECPHRSWNDSVVDDIFGGQLQSTLECQTCRHLSHCFDPFVDLLLPIPSSKAGNVSVQDCMQVRVRSVCVYECACVCHIIDLLLLMPLPKVSNVSVQDCMHVQRLEVVLLHTKCCCIVSLGEGGEVRALHVWGWLAFGYSPPPH